MFIAVTTTHVVKQWREQKSYWWLWWPLPPSAWKRPLPMVCCQAVRWHFITMTKCHREKARNILLSALTNTPNGMARHRRWKQWSSTPLSQMHVPPTATTGLTTWPNSPLSRGWKTSTPARWTPWPTCSANANRLLTSMSAISIPRRRSPWGGCSTTVRASLRSTSAASTLVMWMIWPLCSIHVHA